MSDDVRASGPEWDDLELIAGRPNLLARFEFDGGEIMLAVINIVSRKTRTANCKCASGDKKVVLNRAPFRDARRRQVYSLAL